MLLQWCFLNFPSFPLIKDQYGASRRKPINIYEIMSVVIFYPEHMLCIYINIIIYIIWNYPKTPHIQSLNISTYLHSVLKKIGDHPLFFNVAAAALEHEWGDSTSGIGRCFVMVRSSNLHTCEWGTEGF